MGSHVSPQGRRLRQATARDNEKTYAFNSPPSRHSGWIAAQHLSFPAVPGISVGNTSGISTAKLTPTRTDGKSILRWWRDLTKHLQHPIQVLPPPLSLSTSDINGDSISKLAGYTFSGFLQFKTHPCPDAIPDFAVPLFRPPEHGIETATPIETRRAKPTDAERNEWTEIKTDGRTDNKTNGWRAKRMDGEKNGRTDGEQNERTKNKADGPAKTPKVL